MKDQSRRLFKAGSYIYIEGDEDVDDVYIVEKGLVEFRSSNDRVRTHGNNAGPGDVFGFISALSRRPRMETAFAKVNTSVIEFTREKFLLLLKKNSEIAIKLLNSYADELRLYDTLMFPVSGASGVFLPEDMQLFSLGEYYFRMKMHANALYVFEQYLALFPEGTDRNSVMKHIEEIRKTGVKNVPGPALVGIYRRYGDRQIIFCEHEPGNELFIIKKGKVKIVKYHGESEVILSVLKEGEIFGELAIVSDKPRNATAVSFGTTEVLPIDKESLLKLIEKSSDLLLRIFTAISQRVWFTFIRMESKFYEKPITRVYAFLENKLIEDNVSLKSREPHVFNFGIDELLKMNSVSPERVAAVTMELTRDHNLDFNMGRTVINNPGLVSSKARYYRSRDHLYEGSGTERDSDRGASPVVDAQMEEPLGDLADMRLPESARQAEDAGVPSSLFDELEEEVGNADR
ncbi:MAG: cyclic nucleotide-binding domain-containing protein [Spirochaetes bacterium]|nr:cyclic nucleotide-binding domain-containing protein [Spirochaetota bacterium]